MPTQKPLGFVLYSGPSRIDGQPIVAIATGFRRKSRNPKTGDMIQVFILRADVEPTVAINTGDDYSVCGPCPLRGRIEDTEEGRHNRGRVCYVSVRNAPLQVYRGYTRGQYIAYDADQHAHYFEGRALRLGAYGDPCAVPMSVWTGFINPFNSADGLCPTWTGYTHQWNNRVGRGAAEVLGMVATYRHIVMASVDTPEQAALAAKQGWRYFRVAPQADACTGNSGLLKRERSCPASEEAGKRTDCAHCGACNGTLVGTGFDNRRSIVIQVHGSKPILSSYKKLELV
jgi:hypothetical protein